MLDNKTKTLEMNLTDKQKQLLGTTAEELAERIWWKFPAELPDTFRLPCIEEMKDVIYSHLVAEATRAAGLVEALDRVKRQCLACGWREEVRDSVINDILKGVEQALTNYNNPVNK